MPLSFPRASLVFSLCASVAACGGPRPSTVPLGVGPLSPHYKLATAAGSHTRRENRTASGTKEAAAKAESPEKDEPDSKEKEAKAEQTTTDGGGPAGDKKAVTPPDKMAAASSFLGDYRGDDVSTYRLGGTPEHADKDPNARVTVKSSEKTSIDVVLVDSSNGKDICTLNATLGEKNATITAGQKCFEQNNGDESAAATVKSGTVSVEGRTLTLDLAADFEMRTADQEVTGTLDYHFEGRRR
jgi:hypothetical protein